MLRTSFVLIALSSSVLGQSCRPDIVVDDFSTIRNGFLPEEPTNPKIFNTMGGDYGASSLTNFTVDTAAKAMTIVPAPENIGAPEPWANPGTAETINYWFTKFDLRACFDLRGYTGIAFDLIAPTGSDMNFTMTQRTANCSWRGLDSVYRPLSSYITPDGTKKAVFLPFSDYAKNLRGGDFDFVHLKDWTAVNLVPSGARFVMSNLVLRGNCTTRTATNGTVTTNGTTTGTTTNGTRTNGNTTTASGTPSPRINNSAQATSFSALTASVFGVLAMAFAL